MTASQTILIVAASWLGAVVVVRLAVIPWLERGPGGSAVNGLLLIVARVYLGVMHRPRYRGLDVLPRGDADHDGLVVVANHTGALDPLLIQARCPFWIRWMMASDMMGPRLAWLWRHQRLIPVDRDGRDSAPLREAIRHVKAGGAVGIFPEGRITLPPREIRPFLAGVGLLIARTRAPVLLVWVSGTPETNKLREAFASRSRARVEFVDLVRFDREGDAASIADTLRRRLAQVSGWPLNDEIIPPGGHVEAA